MRQWRMLLTVLAILPRIVFADQFEDAKKAFRIEDYDTAVKLYLPLAERGHSMAQSNLAWMYQTGRGVPKDDRKAVFWYRKAADHGNLTAYEMLGSMYDFGQGVPKDHQQAVFWYRKAAEGGSTSSQDTLATKYINGVGVDIDFQEAYFWLLIACVGDPSLIGRRDWVQGKITTKQRAAAQAKARTWVPR